MSVVERRRRRQRTRHLDDRLHIGAVPPHRHQSVGGAVGVDPRRVRREVRVDPITTRPDHDQVAAGCGHPYELRSEAPAEESQRFLHVAGGRFDGDDPLPIGRPRQLRVQRRRLGELLRLRSRALRVDRDPVDLASDLVVPRDKGDGLAVRRPRRIELPDLLRRQAARSPVRQVRHVQAAERREGQPLAVGRRRDVAHLVGGEGRGVIDPVGEPHLRTGVERDVGSEWDLDCRRLIDRNAPDLTAVRHDDRLVVGREGVAGKHVQR